MLLGKGEARGEIFLQGDEYSLSFTSIINRSKYGQFWEEERYGWPTSHPKSRGGYLQCRWVWFVVYDSGRWR